MKCAVYTSHDGRVVVVKPRAPYRGETLETWLHNTLERFRPADCTDWQIVDQTDLPLYNEWRNAWAIEDGRVVVAMGGARELHRNAIRRVRAPLLAALDIQSQRAMEDGDQEALARIRAEKQELRDMPAHPDIDAASRPEELRRVWPGKAPAPLSVRIAPPMLQPMPSEQEPALPLPQPVAERGFEQQTYSFKELLEKADQPDEQPIAIPPLPVPADPIIPDALPPLPIETFLSEATRRTAAKGHVRQAVADSLRVSIEDQRRYEQALQAHNGNVAVIELMAIEAAVRKVTVAQLAQLIIAEHTAWQRRAHFVWAIEAEAMRRIDEVSGEDIDRVAREAAARIRGEEDGE